MKIFFTYIHGKIYVSSAHSPTLISPKNSSTSCTLLSARLICSSIYMSQFRNYVTDFVEIIFNSARSSPVVFREIGYSSHSDTAAEPRYDGTHSSFARISKLYDGIPDLSESPSSMSCISPRLHSCWLKMVV